MEDTPTPTLPHLLLATRNRHKTAQFAVALAGLFQVSDMADSNSPEVEETGVTFKENAVIKAVEVSRLHPDSLVLADDSGICVEALGGAPIEGTELIPWPGVYSARYAGPGATDAQNNAKMLADLEAIGALAPAQRGAYYQCVLALAERGRLVHTTEGRVEGRVLTEPRGAQGFGYDPFFVPHGRVDDRTFAELSDAEKLPFSHRGKALAAMVEFLAGYRPQ